MSCRRKTKATKTLQTKEVLKVIIVINSFQPYFHNYDFVNSIKFKENGKHNQTKKLLWHTGDSNRIQNKIVGEKRPTFQT